MISYIPPLKISYYILILFIGLMWNNTMNMQGTEDYGFFIGLGGWQSSEHRRSDNTKTEDFCDLPMFYYQFEQSKWVCLCVT